MRKGYFGVKVTLSFDPLVNNEKTGCLKKLEEKLFYDQKEVNTSLPDSFS